MPYNFTAFQPAKSLDSVIKNFFLIEFDKDTTHIDYVLPDGHPTFFYIQTREPFYAHFGETSHPIVVRTGFYVGYSNTLVELMHKRLTIFGASLFPFYFNLIFDRSPQDVLNTFSRLEDIEALKPVESSIAAPEKSFSDVKALFEKYISNQLSRSHFDEDFLFVYERLTQPDSCFPSVEELAAFLGYSTRYLHSHFRHLFGMSPKKFIKLVRFNHALKYLYDSREAKKLSSIAHAVGYHDQSHFIRDFKKITGKTPKEIAGNPGSLANNFRLFWKKN